MSQLPAKELEIKVRDKDVDRRLQELVRGNEGTARWEHDTHEMQTRGVEVEVELNVSRRKSLTRHVHRLRDNSRGGILLVSLRGVSTASSITLCPHTGQHKPPTPLI
ncbi:unnamed protein product [Pleuronectes platessa]|uniref:Uncharacterized protein n=1 Tax=Pleuronectes platessa TaxID=8262 RepID=A0A9N7Y5F1_PLEPL|nr:unnamed protein product [Pleuronectes platessa]